MAEQVDALQSQGGADLRQFVGEALDSPEGGIRRPFATSAAKLIVEDDRSLVRERRQRLEVIVRETGPTVQGEERYAGAIADDAVPDLAARHGEVAFAGGLVGRAH